MLIIDVLAQGDPDKLAEVLQESGMHCLHCMLAHGETLEEAAAVHGINVDELVAKLNAVEIDADIHHAYNHAIACIAPVYAFCRMHFINTRHAPCIVVAHRHALRQLHIFHLRQFAHFVELANRNLCRDYVAKSAIYLHAQSL